MIGDFLEGAMVSATICVTVGILASIVFPPVGILAGAFLGGAVQATSTRKPKWR